MAQFKVNLKVRMRHKTFLASLLALILALANQIAGLFGHDITVINAEITAISETVFMILGLLGIVVDPTTEGIGDSDDAMKYDKPKGD